MRKQKNNIFAFFVNCEKKPSSHGIYSVLWPCTVACTVACTVRALYVHCKTRSLCNSASGGVQAQSLFVGSSCEDERVLVCANGNLFKHAFAQP